jgi:F0F1-type ATP synthase assembly protein I
MVEKMPRSDRQAQPEPVSEAAAWTILSYLISGPLLYGGLGWLVDKWLGTTFFVVVGLLGGMALSIYVIYRRYVSPLAPSPLSAPATLQSESIVAGEPNRTNRAGRGQLSRNQASSSQSPDNNQSLEHQPLGANAETSGGPSADPTVGPSNVIEPDEPINSTATGDPAGGEPTDRIDP